MRVDACGDVDKKKLLKVIDQLELFSDEINGLRLAYDALLDDLEEVIQ